MSDRQPVKDRAVRGHPGADRPPRARQVSSANEVRSKVLAAEFGRGHGSQDWSQLQPPDVPVPAEAARTFLEEALPDLELVVGMGQASAETYNDRGVCYYELADMEALNYANLGCWSLRDDIESLSGTVVSLYFLLFSRVSPLCRARVLTLLAALISTY